MRVLALNVSLIIGMLWTVVEMVMWLYVGGWGITTLNGALLSVLGTVLMFVAPVCLVVGSVLALSRRAPRFYIPMFVIGSLTLTAVVVSSIHDQFHLNSAENPSTLYLGSLTGAALLCDLCAVWLFRDWKFKRSV